MSRFILDSSSGQSSTGLNIRKYIKDTELSDGMINRSIGSTLPSSNDENVNINQKIDTGSFHFGDSNVISTNSQNSNTSNNSNNKFNSIENQLNPILEESTNVQASSTSSSSPSIQFNSPKKSNNDSQPFANSTEIVHDSVNNDEILSENIDSDKENKSSAPKVQSVNFNLPENDYKKNLKYQPNVNFEYNSESPSINSGNYTSLPVSVPNTFKYKSHPNAKTKPSIGKNPPSSNHSSSIFKTPPIIQSNKTMNFNSQIINQNEDDHLNTPDWMPAELNEKWIDQPVNNNNLNLNDFVASVRLNKTPPNLNADDLNLNLSSTNTMIHNSKHSSIQIPMWKKINDEYIDRKQSQHQLQNIFMTNESFKLDSNKFSNNHDNTINNNNSISSTISTPMVSINKTGQFNNIQNNNYQQNLSKNPGSPFKPFEHKHNTFTRNKMSELLENLSKVTPKSKKPEVDEISFNSSNFKVKNLPRNASYSDEQYRQRANNLFDNLQKKGYQGNKSSNKPLKNPSNESVSINGNHTTATSTPKKLNGIDEINSQDTFSSYDSGFDNDDSNSDDNLKKEPTNIDEFTSYEKSQFINNVNNEIQNQNSKSHNESSYTFDDITEINNARNKLPAHLNQPPATDFKFNQSPMKEFKTQSNGQLSQNPIPQLQPMESVPHELGSFIKFQPRNASSSSSSSFDSSEKHDAKVEQLVSRLDQLESAIKEMHSNEDFIKQEYFKLQLENEKLMDALANSNQKTDKIHDHNYYYDHNNNDFNDDYEYDNQKNNEIGSQEISIDDIEISDDHLDNDIIKWKRASQLKLQSDNLSTIPEHPNINDHVVRGRVKPDLNLPVSYDNMVLDIKNQKWVTNDKENQHGGSLDSIEDLITHSEEDDNNLNNNNNNKFQENPHHYNENESPNDGSILKSPHRSARRMNSKLEVSFDLPHAMNSSNDRQMDSKNEVDEFPIIPDQLSSGGSNVTQVSQLDDLTFSQIRKKLVSVITDVLSNNSSDVSWSHLDKISLANCSLDNIKDLYKFLPNLKTINISNNYIKFLEGLPRKCLNLDISNNYIDNITSFKQFKDLQFINASFNSLINLSNFSHNIHLTKLNLQDNRITTLDGIGALTNLTSLNISRNEIEGSIDFGKLNLINLQELNLSENRIEKVIGIENLPNLRVLNLNENHLETLACGDKHLLLKKLLLKFNRLKRLDLKPYPFLRVLRIDGNFINITSDLKRLTYLEEVSCKSQANPELVEKMVSEVSDVTKLDLSGNSYFNFIYDGDTLNNRIKVNPFLNLNNLILSAMGLSKLPDGFSDLFPNVRELNLNFNKLSNIQGLRGMKNLKKVYLLSNNISTIEMILKSLAGSRSTIKLLDFRLNQVNMDHYPYVFNPQELEFSQYQKYTNDSSPIVLETLDDIENFAIHYKSMSKGNSDWSERDSKYVEKLLIDSNPKCFKERLDYETLLINFFRHLKELDGGIISHTKRMSLKRRMVSGSIDD